MRDLVLALLWCALLGAGVVGCVALRRAGLAATWVRDLLHIGAGVWVFGWPLWGGAWAPIAITAAALVATAAVPLVATRVALVDRFRRSVTGGDETWLGLPLYVGAFALFTALGTWRWPLPAAAGLLALALGDGLGGLVGRHVGRVRFRAPGGKRKSLEGSVTVGVMAGVGCWLASWWLGVPAAPGLPTIAGLTAAVAEAAAPRSSDNLIVPAAVFVAVLVAQGVAS